MPHYCRICKRERPNERFSGKGHRSHVCKKCQKRPRDEHREIDTMDNLRRLLTQSVISQKNIAMLEELRQDPNPRLARGAELLLEVAAFRPGKRRRVKLLIRERPNLLHALYHHSLLPGRILDQLDLLGFDDEDPRDLTMWLWIQETPRDQEITFTWESLRDDPVVMEEMAAREAEEELEEDLEDEESGVPARRRLDLYEDPANWKPLAHLDGVESNDIPI